MKKAILFLITALLFTQTTFAFYSDVPETHEYYDSIKYLYDAGLLPEYNDNLFNPDEKVKITDLYELLLSYGQVELTEESFLQTAISLGLLNSVNLNLDLTLAKHYVLSTLFKTLGIGVNYFFDQSSFPFIDVKINSNTAAIAKKAADLGILESQRADLFKMAKRVTRAQTADYLYKIHNSQPQGQTIRIEIGTAPTGIDQDLLENEKFAILMDIWSSLKNDYYYQDEVDEDELLTGAIEGMVNEIDDAYTTYHTPEEASQFLNGAGTQEYEGVGMLIETIDGNAVIISPFKDSPAEEAGLIPNDMIVEVNDENVEGLVIEAIADRIKGPSGTQVKITILRDGNRMNFTVTREFILYSTVQYRVIQKNSKNIGYIEILLFDLESYNEFLEAAEALVAENIEGLIIDLRNNPGGYVDTTIDIISLFTDEVKTAVQMIYSDGSTEIYQTDENGLLKDYETVILINEGSASASEILAGTLRDYGIAKIIGTTSFGKGSVQSLTEYSDGSMFKYTVAKWLTANGNDIAEVGIIPDEIVKNTGNTDNQLNEALAEF